MADEYDDDELDRHIDAEFEEVQRQMDAQIQAQTDESSLDAPAGAVAARAAIPNLEARSSPETDDAADRDERMSLGGSSAADAPPALPALPPAGGVGAGAAAAAPAPPSAAKKTPNCYEAMGAKRQRLHPPAPPVATAAAATDDDEDDEEEEEDDDEEEEGAGDAEPEPAPDDASDISEARRIPCLLSWVLTPRAPLFGTVLTFEQIYAHRCLRGTEYAVNLNGAEDRACDGLASYLGWRVLQLLEGAPLAQLEAAFAIGGGGGAADSVRRALASEAPATEDDGAVRALWVHRLQVRLAQLAPADASSVGAAASTERRHRGAWVDGNLLRCGNHEAYRPTTRDEALAHSSVTLTLGDDAMQVVVRVNADGVCTKRLGHQSEAAAAEWAAAPGVAPEAVDALLLPATWGLRDVVRVRRLHAHPSLATDPVTDPYSLCLIAAAIGGKDTPNRWVELLRMASAGQHVGVDDTVSGHDHVAIWTCSPESGLWARDKSNGDLKALIRRVCYDVCDLATNMRRADGFFKHALKRRYFLGEEVCAFVSPKDLENFDNFGAGGAKGLSNEEMAHRKQMFVMWHWSKPGQRDYRRVKLSERLAGYHPARANRSITPLLLREPFADAIKAPNGTVEWDRQDIVCFSDKWAWCGRTATWRRIVATDYATHSVGYPRPTLDEAKRRLLLGFLREVHSDPSVLAWRLGLKARALHSSQAGPVCLSSQGAAGGCKSLETQLTMAAFGEAYATTIDVRALCTIKNSSADGPSPALLGLRHKRYVCAEVRRLAPAAGDPVATPSPDALPNPPVRRKWRRSRPRWSSACSRATRPRRAASTRRRSSSSSSSRCASQRPSPAPTCLHRAHVPCASQVLELLSNLPDDPEDRIRFSNDDGMVRSVPACV